MFEVHIGLDLAFGGLRLFIVDKDPVSERITAYAKPMTIEFEPVEFGKEFEIRKPTLKLEHHRGRELLEALSKALVETGFRDKAVSKDGEIKRMENHLEDMRKIVFDETVDVTKYRPVKYE